MFAIHRLKRSITRNLTRSGLLVVASFLLICFLCVYINSIWSNEQLLTNMGRQISVTATIANSNGSREFGLSIFPKYVDGLINAGITNPVITAESYGNIDREKLNAGSGIISIYLLGTNSMDAFTFGEDAIVADEPLEFLTGDEPKCIMNSVYISRNDLNIAWGDVIDINLYRADYDSSGYAFEFFKVAPARLTVVGFYSSELSGGVQSEAPDIICPVQWLRREYEAAGAPFKYSSAKGTVADPLALNEFKEKAEELNFKQVNPQKEFSRTGNALLVSDKVFIQAASQIKRNIHTLRLFFGPSVFLVFVLMTLVSFFLSRSRRDEILIAQCLGMKRASIRFELAAENGILALVGGVMAGIIMSFAGMRLAAYLLIFLLCMLCIVAGSLASAYMLTRVNAMELMARVE